ncbi:putative otopetrin [Operophtera brumata]|uniref:Putative otopetrin n=1 Tax=Operophtera brumata TaxID=104452 RepID=A0A0L7KWN5_OPEBR|nr:putative otopetrin [Operophtera brumata]
MYRGNESRPATPTVGETNSNLPYNNQNGIYRNGDTKSLSNYRLYIPANDMRGNATPRKRSVATMDAQSLRQYLSLVMSAIYAVLLVTLGIIFYLGDSFVDYQISLIYSTCLCSIGLVYLLFLMTDINRYKSIALKNQRTKGLHEENISEYFRKQEEEYSQSSPSTPGDRTPEVLRPASVPPPILIPLKHQYCFNQGRHSGSFYLKMGAAAFAIGHLVHSVLLIAVQLGFLFDSDVSNDDCLDIMQIVLDVLFPCYCFLQLYFIFKYSNVIILRGQCLARFAFMHMIGSSLCFWVSAIVRETTLALTIYANSVYGNGEYGTNATRKHDDELTGVAAKNLNRFLDVSNLYNENCTGSKAISSIVENFSPYLFPFSVEFNILIVAIYYIIWSNIGNCDNDDTSSETTSTFDENFICKIPTANEDNDFTSNIVIHADCHASNRGLFAGIMLLVVVIGMLIIGFVFSSVGGEHNGQIEPDRLVGRLADSAGELVNNRLAAFLSDKDIV